MLPKGVTIVILKVQKALLHHLLKKIVNLQEFNSYLKEKVPNLKLARNSVADISWNRRLQLQ